MVFAPRIKALSALRTPTSALHVLVDAQDIFTRSAKHCLYVPLVPWPYAGLVGLLCIMAADAGVELLTAEVLDGNDVERRVPVGALSQRGDGETVNNWSRR